MNRTNKQTALSCSVIIPAFNSADYIPQALNSLLEQSWPPDEILVVDNNSTDETAALVSTFAAPVQLLREPRQGASFARNRGIEAATGEIIAFLDADDISLPHRIEKQLQVLAIILILTWFSPPCHIRMPICNRHKAGPDATTFMDRAFSVNCWSAIGLVQHLSPWPEEVPCWRLGDLMFILRTTRNTISGCGWQQPGRYNI